MSRLLLHLRNVPDDEADAIRTLLDDADLAWYETRASLWGVSPGGLWLKHADDLPRARELLATFQTERAARARAERAAALAEGRADTFLTMLRDHPLRVVVILLAALFFAALTAWPFFVLM